MGRLHAPFFLWIQIPEYGLICDHQTAPQTIASASPENLLGMNILEPYPDLLSPKHGVWF